MRCTKYNVLMTLLACLLMAFYQMATMVIIENMDSMKTRRSAKTNGLPLLTFEKLQKPHHCPYLKRPKTIPDGYLWQTVANQNLISNKTQDSIYLFSAYYDAAMRRTEPLFPCFVRIIGIYSSFNGSLFCQIWYNQGQDTLVISANTTNIPEDRGKRYKAVFITCELPTREAPYAVSVVRNKCDPPQNLLVVQQSNSPGRRHYTVCVTPLNLNYNNVYQLVEMMEVNMLFGADSFVFYNYSAGPDVSRILEQYQKESMAEVIQWHIPVNVDTWPPTSDVEIHYFGQLAALNDCLYRRRSSDYVVFTDLDELIIPRKHRTWSEMLAELNNEDGGKHDIFMFRCAFFRKDWPDLKEDFLNKSAAVKYKLNTLLKIQRESLILQRKERPKLMVKPLKVETIGIHQVWSALPGSREFMVHPSVGLLHHYRDWENPNDTNRETDKNLHRFRKDIIRKINLRWHQLLRDEKINIYSLSSK